MYVYTYTQFISPLVVFTYTFAFTIYKKKTYTERESFILILLIRKIWFR